MRLPLSSFVTRALVLMLLLSLAPVRARAESWQAGDVAAAERYRAEERARAERYRTALEEEANAKPSGAAARVGDVVAERAQGLGESLADWLGSQLSDALAQQLEGLREALEPQPERGELQGEQAPRGLREWIARERERARELVERSEAEAN